MPAELRKRKAPAPAPPPPAKRERKPKAEKATAGDAPATSATTDSPPAPAKPTEPVATAPAPKAANSEPPKVGDKIDLDGFGGEIETHEGQTTSLKALVEDSKAGVVLFTYPKASTPGCTTQVCLFRDSFTPLTATGLSIFGLSRDSAKSNTTFKTKQNLPYALLCDKSATLIQAIGFKNGDKTQRGVFVVKKDGQVLAAEPGGPAATVDVVKGIVEKMGGASAEGKQQLDQAKARATAAEGDEVKPDTKKKRGGKKQQTPAEVAAEVADTAATL